MTVHFLREGDQQLPAPRNSERTRESNWDHCVKQIRKFVFELMPVV